MHRRLKRSHRLIGLWSTAALALMLAACTTPPSSGHGETDAGDTDGEPQPIPIPDPTCWGPEWKCSDGGMRPDGGDQRAPIVFRASLTGALVVPAVPANGLEGSAKLTLDGAQKTLKVEVQHNASAASSTRLLLRRGGPGETTAETLSEIDPASTEPIPVTADALKSLLRGELFLEVTANGSAVLRGQILREDETLYVAHLNGDEASTPHGTTESVTVYLVHNRSTEDYRYWVPKSQSTHVPTSMELDLLSGSTLNESTKFADLTPTSDGVGDSSQDTLSGYGTGEFNTTDKPSTPLRQGQLVVKAHLSGTPGEELVGTLTLPGSRLFVAALDGLQLNPVVTTTSLGAARFVVNYLSTEVAYTVSTTAMSSEISLRSLGRDTATVPALYAFSPDGPNARIVTVGTGSSQFPPTALDAIQGARAFVFVKSKEKDVNNADKYPYGELAGVVHGPGEAIYRTALSPALNPNSQTATGGGEAWLFVDAAQTRMRYFVKATGVPVKTVSFDVAPARAPVQPLAQTIELGDVASETSGVEQLPAGTPYAAGLATGTLRVRVGSVANDPETTEIAGHFVHPGESLYVAELSPRGIFPMPAASPSAGYAMAVIDAKKTKARISGSAITVNDVSGIKVCSGVAGATGTNCTSLTAGPAGVPASATVTYDEATFAEGRWFVQVETDASQFPNGELRGPLVRQGETVLFAYLKQSNVKQKLMMTPSPLSTATAQVVFIANADKTSIRFNGTLMGVTPTGAGWGSLRAFKPDAVDQTVPLFPTPIVLKDVSSASLSGELTGQSQGFYHEFVAGSYAVDILPNGSNDYLDGLIRGDVKQ